MQAGGPRILVIDDEQRSRIQLAQTIEREGWSFYFAETVEEASAAVRDLAPEVIVLEPRAEGGKATGLLTALRRGEWIPVVILTSDPAIDAEWGLEHGASGVFRKPEGIEGLRNRIAELLDRRRTDRPA